MIGRMKYGEHVLTLEDDFTWTCEDLPLVAEMFNLAFPYEAVYGGPQDGYPGPSIYYRVLKKMECEVIDAPEPIETPDIPGLVY